MRALIVDDEPLARNALEHELRKRSDIEELGVAVDAVDAFDKLHKKDYDVLLLDIHMPEMSGIELVDRLRKLGRPIPAIIFVTAHHEHALAAFEHTRWITCSSHSRPNAFTRPSISRFGGRQPNALRRF